MDFEFTPRVQDNSHFWMTTNLPWAVRSLSCPESGHHCSDICGASDSRQAGRTAKPGPGLAAPGHSAQVWVQVLLFREEMDKIWRVSRGNGLEIIIQRVKLKRRVRELPLVIFTDFLRQGWRGGVLFWVVTVDWMELRGTLIWLNVKSSLRVFLHSHPQITRAMRLFGPKKKKKKYFDRNKITIFTCGNVVMKSS